MTKGTTSKKPLPKRYLEVLTFHTSQKRLFARGVGVKAETVAEILHSGMTTLSTFEKLADIFSDAGLTIDPVEVFSAPSPVANRKEDLPGRLQALVQAEPTSERVTSECSKLYHECNQPRSALLLGRGILGQVKPTWYWEWDDRCDLIGRMIHYAKRSGDAGPLADLLRTVVIPALDEAPSRQSRPWPVPVVYLAGQLLDLFLEYPTSDFALVDQLANNLRMQLRVKVDADCRPHEFNVACFAIASHEMACLRTQPSLEALSLADNLRGRHADNHRTAYLMRSVERQLHLPKSGNLEGPLQQLKTALQDGVARLERSTAPGIGYAISGISFSSAMLCLRGAAFRLGGTVADELPQEIESLTRRFVRCGAFARTDMPLPRVRPSPILRRQIERISGIGSIVMPAEPEDSAVAEALAAATRALLSRFKTV